MIRKLTVAATLTFAVGALAVPVVSAEEPYVKKNPQTVCWGECPAGPDPMMVVVDDAPGQEPQTPVWSPPDPPAAAVAPTQWPTAPAVQAPAWPTAPAVAAPAWPTVAEVLDPTIRIRPAVGPF